MRLSTPHLLSLTRLLLQIARSSTPIGSETEFRAYLVLGNSSLAPFLFPRHPGEVLASIWTAKERMAHKILRFCKKGVYADPWAALSCIP